MQYLIGFIRGLFGDREEGQGLVEYGLIIALVAVLAIAGLILFGEGIGEFLDELAGSI